MYFQRLLVLVVTCCACVATMPFTRCATAEAEAPSADIFTVTVDETEVKIYIPSNTKTLRGVLVHAANYPFKPGDRWCELCNEMGFANLSMKMANFGKVTNRGPKLHKALHDGLKQLAEKSGHPELTTVPLAGTGHSAGGLVVPVLLKNPERMLTAAVDCGGVHEPEKWPAEANGVPVLWTVGAIPDGFKFLETIESRFVPARKKGLPWGAGLQWGCAHDWANAGALVLPWLRGAVTARLQKDGTLVDVKPESGWLGDRGTIESNYATVAPYADFTGDKSIASWFPDREVAFVWRSWESKEAAFTIEAATVDGTSKLRAWGPKLSRDLQVNPGMDVVLSILAKKPDAAPAPQKVQFFDGDRLLGEATSAPWTLTWKQPQQGVHSVYAQWTEADGKPRVTNPALVIIRLKNAPVVVVPKK